MAKVTIIREATANDAAAIAAIHVKTWRAAYAGIMPAAFLEGLSEETYLAFWEKELAANVSVNRVALEGRQIVGWASGGPNRDADCAEHSEIYAIYVSPDTWSRGIGRLLMRRMENDLSAMRWPLLWVLEQNLRALRFYHKQGYQADGTARSLPIGGVELKEIRLRKMGWTPAENSAKLKML
ncbi:MAG: GNAT family N-acetyltransferase [Verrucomicrobiaceae bacterium]|nr:MAG: GNAT family N-acetyltransferase [Verrucomicrobiaceae bacterium]